MEFEYEIETWVCKCGVAMCSDPMCGCAYDHECEWTNTHSDY